MYIIGQPLPLLAGRGREQHPSRVHHFELVTSLLGGWCVQDMVLVIYTVSYPPRLVPVSLVSPGLGTKSSSVFASVPDTAPAPEHEEKYRGGESDKNSPDVSAMIDASEVKQPTYMHCI